MKNLKAPFLAFALILFNISIVSAGAASPPPPTKEGITARTANADDDGEGPLDDDGGLPGQPILPIDQNIMILLIGGLALGATVIYRNQTKKASK
ncbi:hypothetical protein [Flavobacterium phragmitis]|uniref:LPXTG-motif cell wall anchor domain-containing protein n=1 Tax=Flavobacterium phragmitis TaxID=739143 RepID=A0A1I1S2W1_9FLAO|nr:hypothetical protein [Flavobacterium phragmitis]SFD38103.1 hypothetical protein SAMN05216297_107171 [Flavobacterium phragmitis]